MSFFLVAGYSNARAQLKQTTCGNKKADKLLDQGTEAYKKKDYAQAVSFYDQAAKAASKCPVPYFQKALALFDSKRYDETIIAYQEALSRNYTETFRIYFGICEAQIQQEKFEEANKNCEESARLNDNFYWTFYKLAISHINLTNLDKALTAIRRASELDPKSTDALILKARILNSLKKYDEALIDLTTAIKLNPNSDEAALLLGINYYLIKDYAKAVEYLTQTVKLNPDTFEAWLLLSSSHVAYSQNWRKAEEAAIQSVRIKPNNGEANFTLGMAQLINGKLELAVKSFDNALKNKSLFPVASTVYKGYALLGMKRTAEAEKSFQQALTFKPVNKTDYIALSEIYYYRWEIDKFRELIKKGIDFAADDEDSEEYSSLSWSYSLSNEPQMAIIAANESLRQNPKDYNAYANRCRAFFETNLPDIAINDCQKSLELKSENGEVFFYLGLAYGLKKDAVQKQAYNRKAIAALEKKLGVSFNPQKERKPANVPKTSTPSSTDAGTVSISSPTSAYNLYLLGNAYYYENNFEAAVGAYEKVVELRPRFPRLRFNLAFSYLRLKRPDLKKAEAQYNALLLIDKNMAANLKKIINGFRGKK
jgi:tetratricopeptide (TPR) repeat protein